MKTTWGNFRFAPVFILATGLLGSSVAKGLAAETVPAINFQNVPITRAMENLARMAEMNFIINPPLFLAPDGSRKPEPALTLNWTNCSALEALSRITREHGLSLTTNAFTGVVCIAGANHVANAVDAKLLGADTNGVIPMIRFEDVPLDVAISEFARRIETKIILDPKVTGETPPVAPDFKMASVPRVSVRWNNLTARQIVVELCDVYGLEIVQGSAPDTVLIRYRK